MQEIVCAVCGRRLAAPPGIAVACPSCGAPVSSPPSSAEDDSATRPAIPPVDTAQQTAQTADDETTRAALPYIASIASPGHDTTDSGNTGAVTADYPMPPKPERTQTVPPPAMPATESQTQPVQPLEPSAAPVPPVPPGALPPARRKRGRFPALSIVLLIVLLIAVGAAGVLFANGRLPFIGATPTATIAATETPAPTATTPGALTIFTDADHVFSIGYPTAWLMTTQNAANSQQRLVIFSNPNTGANFNVGTLSTTDVPAQQVVEQTLTVTAQKTGIASRTGPTTARVGGETWTQESGIVTLIINKQPTPVQATALAIIHGNHTIYMLELAPVSAAPAIQPTFQQMLQSFQFLQ